MTLVSWDKEKSIVLRIYLVYVLHPTLVTHLRASEGELLLYEGLHFVEQSNSIWEVVNVDIFLFEPLFLYKLIYC